MGTQIEGVSEITMSFDETKVSGSWRVVGTKSEGALSLSLWGLRKPLMKELQRDNTIYVVL